MAPQSLPRSRRRTSQSSSGSSGSDYTSSSSSTSSQSSLDEDAVNMRVTPYWCAYRCVIESRGFRLDTYKDVKAWYHEYWASLGSQGHTVSKDLPGYIRACRGKDENELCRDDGLVCVLSSTFYVGCAMLTVIAGTSVSRDAMFHGCEGRHQGRASV